MGEEEWHYFQLLFNDFYGSDLFLLIEEQQNSVTSFANQVQNAVKHAQRNIALQETTFLPSVSIPKVIRNTVDK